MKLKDGKVDFLGNSFTHTDIQLFIFLKHSEIVSGNSGFINESISDVIEFYRCKIVNGYKIEYGRLWVELKYWDKQGQLITKEKWLSERFEFYRKWIKKNCRISKDKGFYIFDEAYKLYREGKMQMISPINYVVEFD